MSSTITHRGCARQAAGDGWHRDRLQRPGVSVRKVASSKAMGDAIAAAALAA